MPIKQFASETIRVLGVALEMTCIALRTGDCADDVKQAIADKLVDLANAGERNPDVLCEQALKEFFLTERQQRIAGVESRCLARCRWDSTVQKIAPLRRPAPGMMERG
jgi:hypothetical protein